MRRELRQPRPDCVQKVEQLGLTFHTLDGKPYWNESACYRFSAHEIEEIEKATNELHQLCLEAVDYVIDRDMLDKFRIPPAAHSVIARAWEDDPPALYGRFDLSYDGELPPKMLEYNADTPTSLLEAAVVQWHWLQEVEPGADQFNSIWEALLEKWADLRAEGLLPSGLVHFGCMDVMEDLMTTAVIMDAAAESGLEVNLLDMRDVGWDGLNEVFVDLEGRRIETMFKLYPWEWMLEDKFAKATLSSYRSVQWIEPIWKMILSNKALLAILWEMAPGHPNLLPAYLDGPRELGSFVRKPLLGREGANVSIWDGQDTIEVDGPYEETGWLWQAYAPLAQFEGNHALIGSWVIDGTARGIGVRESDGPITEDHARFVPHCFQS